MGNTKTINFRNRLKSMLKLDFQRCFKSKLFYIIVGCALVMPILILVMTTLMDGQVSVDPQTGKETIMEGFKNVWEIIGTVTNKEQSIDTSSSMSMGLTTMCNINLIYFIVAVFVCIFVAEDFRSGYSKNLFTTRSKKVDYIISKTIITCFVGMCMIVAFFIGAMIGGGIAGLSFALQGVNIFNIIMCLLSKCLLMLAIVPIYLTMAIFSKQRLWLSLLLSLAGGALLFMMIPMITPLDANFLNLILCLTGGIMLSCGLGYISNLFLTKRDIL